MIGATLLAAAAWFLFLSHSLWLFSGSQPVSRHIESLDVRLAEWPPSPPEQDGTERGASEKPEKTRTRPAPHPAARAAPAPPRPHDVARASQPIKEQPPLAVSRPPGTERQPEPVPALRTSPATADAAVAHAGTNLAPPASAAQSTGIQSASAATGSARIVSQPIPVLPDDLREEGYRFVAIARFVIHPDGTFDVVLIKPTPNPRLNQILIATLHEWRFVPATEAGHPVESHQEVRVHFNVD